MTLLPCPRPQRSLGAEHLGGGGKGRPALDSVDSYVLPGLRVGAVGQPFHQEAGTEKP